MVHKCYIDGSSVACFEEQGELWVKEFADGKEKEGRTYPVKFCPQCGHTIKPSFTAHFSGSHTLKSQVVIKQESDDPIQKFSASLANTVRDMNQNINAIKAFMMSQNMQNELMSERGLDNSKNISELRGKLAQLQDKEYDSELRQKIFFMEKQIEILDRRLSLLKD